MKPETFQMTKIQPNYILFKRLTESKLKMLPKSAVGQRGEKTTTLTERGHGPDLIQLGDSNHTHFTATVTAVTGTVYTLSLGGRNH